MVQLTHRVGHVLGLSLLLGLVAWLSFPAAGLTSPPPSPDDKIEPQLLQALGNRSKVDFFIHFSTQADLSPAAKLTSKAARGRFVYEALQQTADRSQAEVRQVLKADGYPYRPFYISNKILVQGGTETLLFELAARRDVARLTLNKTYRLPPLQPLPEAGIARQAVADNLRFIKVDEVWALGYRGQGLVLAANDTGLQWDHPALIEAYRGEDALSVNHNYRWWDATGTYTAAPGDGHGHGTHVSGIMVGSDAGGQAIGVAPAAELIHCKNMTDEGIGSDASFSECFEWNLAPWDLNGQNPRPDLAPDVVNNSWGYAGGNIASFSAEIAALQAAGILVEAAAGNEGPGCQSLRSPGDTASVLTVGSADFRNLAHPGRISAFSSRGGSLLAPAAFVPDLLAPGETIRASIPGDAYASLSGTSMAGPHVSAIIGLMWAAQPQLRGQVSPTVQLLLDTAVPLSGQFGSKCGGDYQNGPNQDWGFGLVDAMAAVQAALTYGQNTLLTGRITNARTANPIAGAEIRATLSPSLSWQTHSNTEGWFDLDLLSGTYRLDIAAYGYAPYQADLFVPADLTTTHNITLTARPSYILSGTLRDAMTGWPVYGQLRVAGAEQIATWSNPKNGFYSLTLSTAQSHTLIITGERYLTKQRNLPLTGVDQTRHLTLTYSPNAACPPNTEPRLHFVDSFEQHQPGPAWQTLVTGAGRLRLSDLYPYQGNFSMLLDANSNVGTDSLAALILSQTLSTDGAPQLGFAWREFNDENHAADGVFLRPDNKTWLPIYSFNDGSLSYIETNLDLRALAAAQGYSLSRTFQIKFQFYDNYAIPNDGYALDEIVLRTCESRSSSRLSGIIRDANTGRPLANASVGTVAGQAARSDARGVYQLWLSAGAQQLTITHPAGYAALTATTMLTAWQSQQQNFDLAAGRLHLEPVVISTTVSMGQTQMQWLTLTNRGGHILTYSLVLSPGLAEIGPVDATWPSQQGQLPAGSTTRLSLTITAAPTATPGLYQTHLQTQDSSPYKPQSLPLRVNVPAKPPNVTVQGQVFGLGRCDRIEEAIALPQARVRLEPVPNDTRILSGSFAITISHSALPISGTVVAPGYISQTLAPISGTMGQTLFLSPTLRPKWPCLDLRPNRLSLTLAVSNSHTIPLELYNYGGNGTPFTFSITSPTIPGLQVNIGRQVIAADSYLAPALFIPPMDLPAGVYTARLTLRAAAVEQPPLHLPLTLTYRHATLNVATPIRQQWADPGEIVSYALWLTNTSQVSDAIGLGWYLDHNWPFTGATFVSNLAAGDSTQLVYQTRIPSNALAFDDDTVQLRAWPISNRINGQQRLTLTTYVLPIYRQTLSTSQRQQSGSPGDTLTYTLILHNRGNISSTYHLSLSLAAGLQVNSFSHISEIVPPNTRTSLTLTLQLPLSATPGTNWPITVTATPASSNQATSTLRLHAEIRPRPETPVYSFSLRLEPDSRTGPPGQSMSFGVRLHNLGSQPDTYTLKLTSQPGWQSSLLSQTDVLSPGVVVHFPFHLISPMDATAQTQHQFTLTVRSRTQLPLIKSRLLTVVLNTVPAWQTSVHPVQQAVHPGRIITYQLHLTNTGNLDLQPELNTSFSPWPIRLPNLPRLPIGQHISAPLSLQVPHNTPAGSHHQIHATLSAPGSGLLPQSFELTTTVAASYNFHISSDRLEQTVTPGTPVAFSFHLTNTGNISDRYRLQPQPNRGVLQAPTQTMWLPPAQSQRLTLLLHPTANEVSSQTNHLQLQSQSDSGLSRTVALVMQMRQSQPEPAVLFLPLILKP